MKFADTRTNEAVELLGTKVDGKDKRRAPRRNIRTSIRILTEGENPAELRDLSARGARLWVSQAIAKDTQFVLNLPSRPGTKRAPIICQVVHCRRDPAGGFSIGVEFVGSVQHNAKSAASAKAQMDRIRDSILS